MLGCHATYASLASEYASWLDYYQVTNLEPSRKLLNEKLLNLGVASQHLKDCKVVYLDVNNSSK